MGCATTCGWCGMMVTIVLKMVANVWRGIYAMGSKHQNWHHFAWCGIVSSTLFWDQTNMFRLPTYMWVQALWHGFTSIHLPFPHSTWILQSNIKTHCQDFCNTMFTPQWPPPSQKLVFGITTQILYYNSNILVYVVVHVVHFIMLHWRICALHEMFGINQCLLFQNVFLLSCSCRTPQTSIYINHNMQFCIGWRLIW